MAKADELKRHMDRWQAAQDGRSRWTREARLDLAYLAGKVWTLQELEIFEREGREPPNYNLIFPVVNLVAGVEAQSRSDVAYLPRGPQDSDGADAATKLGMFVRDQNSGERQLSKQFWDAITTGVGWQEIGYASDPLAFPLFRKRENPFNIYWDPCGKEPDMSDWLDMFRSIVTYPDQLAMRFPRFKSEIMAAANADPALRGDLNHSADYTNTHGDYPDVGMFEDLARNLGLYEQGNKPAQVRAVERWYKVEEWSRFVRLRDGRVIEPDPANVNQIRWLAGQLVERDGLDRPMATLIRGIVPRIRVAIFLPVAGGVLLNDQPSPYTHNRFPFVPLWAYEDDRGIPMGLIRQQRTPVRDFNARMAHLLKRSLTNQTHFEEGAFIDDDEALSEIAKSNGAVRYTPGALSGGRAVVRNNLEATPLEQSILQLDQTMIQDYSGVTAELLGQETNAKSGTAIQARQAQGQTRLYTLFDSRNWTQERVAELELANIQATFTEEMVIRVNESPRGTDFVVINQMQPDGSVANAITDKRFDVKISLKGIRDTAMVAALEALTNMAGQMGPDLQILFAPQIARLASQAAGIPDAQQFIDEIEQVKQAMMTQMTGGGQPAPDPQAMQMQQQAAHLDLAAKQAEVEHKQADTMLKQQKLAQQAIMPQQPMNGDIA